MAAHHFPEEVIEDVYVPEKRICVSKLDHVGNRYGKWTVLKRVGASDYRVKCDCGFTAKRRIQNLYHGKSLQCVMCAHRNKPAIRRTFFS